MFPCTLVKLPAPSGRWVLSHNPPCDAALQLLAALDLELSCWPLMLVRLANCWSFPFAASLAYRSAITHLLFEVVEARFSFEKQGMRQSTIA